VHALALRRIRDTPVKWVETKNDVAG
jgi:hypothetical protein